jgi:predicted nuclease of predicted toxin-antitoxin system
MPTIGPTSAHLRPPTATSCNGRHATGLTADLDYSAILAASGDKGPSVVQVRADLLIPAAIGDAVLAALRNQRKDIEAGAIVTLDAYRARVRILPLEP